MIRIAVSGHRDLTPEVASLIDQAVRAELATYRGAELLGMSCLASGADQIFARAVLAVGGQLEVYVPAAQYRARLPDEAKPGYDDLISEAVAVHRFDHEESTP
ncbi:MAG TPA: hypothetical protein VFE14_20050, partial [Micromonosporaceae bacterium]|nr:hypothetical protein [Micromonosporaceae bacterium]